MIESKISHACTTNAGTKLISLVCPCHNEEDNIRDYFSIISSVIASSDAYRFELIFVDDGSTDNTIARILESGPHDFDVKIIELSRNFGKEAALTAGLEHASGDAVIPMDVDMQDPPELIPQMLSLWQNSGYEMVLAHRIDRTSDTLSKRWSARAFYRLHNFFAHPKLPENTGDFRLMDRLVVNAILRLPERQRFMKGIFSWVGFRTCAIDFVRPVRKTGSTKFSFWKLWNLGVESITGFSTAPLRLWSYLGALISLISFLYAGYIIWRAFNHRVDVPGYASTIVLILFLGGIQLIGIGVLGEYLGRTYMETKQRPIYITRKVAEIPARAR